MGRIKDGAQSCGLNHQASIFEMTLLGMLVLGVVEKTAVIITIMDIYEGELAVRCYIPSVYITLCEVCEVSSIIRPIIQVRKLKHRKMNNFPKATGLVSGRVEIKARAA